jgi:hypothetical protein
MAMLLLLMWHDVHTISLERKSLVGKVRGGLHGSLYLILFLCWIMDDTLLLWVALPGSPKRRQTGTL